MGVGRLQFMTIFFQGGQRKRGVQANLERSAGNEMMRCEDEDGGVSSPS